MTTTFEQQFNDQLDAIEREAAEIGETWTSICRATGVSRATPDRWRKGEDPPRTVQIIDEMRGYLERRRIELEKEGRLNK